MSAQGMQMGAPLPGQLAYDFQEPPGFWDDDPEALTPEDAADAAHDDALGTPTVVFDAIGELLADNESAFVPAPWDDLDPTLMTAGQLLVTALSGHPSASLCALALRERIAALPMVQECIQERAAELLEQQQ